MHDDQVDAMAYALKSLPKPHRPLLTRHGTHCTCGVFCGSGRNLKAWRSHAADRFLLDPTTRLNTQPIGENWHNVMQSMTAIAAAQVRVWQRVSGNMKNAFLKGIDIS